MELYGLDAMERAIPGSAENLLDEFRTLKHFGNHFYADKIDIIIVTGDTRTELG